MSFFGDCELMCMYTVVLNQDIKYLMKYKCLSWAHAQTTVYLLITNIADPFKMNVTVMMCGCRCRS